jgi:uncharacterized protein YndB with AHSA1/START domain
VVAGDASHCQAGVCGDCRGAAQRRTMVRARSGWKRMRMGPRVAWEPPHRVAFSWHLQPDWKFDPNPEKASEVEIRFIEEGAGKTRIELEHRGLERHGAGWEQLRAGVDGGWGMILEEFAKAAQA